MLPIPLADTPASAPAEAGPTRARARGGIDVAAPQNGGAKHAAAKTASFATLIEAGLFGIGGTADTATAMAAEVDAPSLPLAAASQETASTNDAPALPSFANRVATGDGRQHRGLHAARGVRPGGVSLIPAWLTSATASAPRSDASPTGERTAATNGNSGAPSDASLDDSLVTAMPLTSQFMSPGAFDLHALATQIPVPGDEEDTPTPAASSTIGVDGSVTPESDQGQPTTLGRRTGLRSSLSVASPGSGERSGAPVAGAAVASAHASETALEHASEESALNRVATLENQSLGALPADATAQPSSTDPSSTRLDAVSGPDAEAAQRVTGDERTSEPPSSGATTRTPARQLAHAFSTAMRTAGPAAAPQTAANAANGSNQTLVPAIATTATDSPRPPGDRDTKSTAPANLAAFRQDASIIPSIRFSDTTDADTNGGTDDLPRDQRQQPLPSVMTRLAGAVASAAGDAHASAQAHVVAPVFTAPTAATQSTTSTAAASDVGTTQNAPTIDPHNVGRIVQSMHVSAKSGVMEATVRLRPDYLGEVTIQLRVDGSAVSAVGRAEGAGVRQWLESQEQTIRSGLAEHGLELSRFVVDPDDQSSSQDDARPDPEEQRRAAFRRRQSQSSQRFEITV